MYLRMQELIELRKSKHAEVLNEKIGAEIPPGAPFSVFDGRHKPAHRFAFQVRIQHLDDKYGLGPSRTLLYDPDRTVTVQQDVRHDGDVKLAQRFRKVTHRRSASAPSNERPCGRTKTHSSFPVCSPSATHRSEPGSRLEKERNPSRDRR